MKPLAILPRPLRISKSAEANVSGMWQIALVAWGIAGAIYAFWAIPVVQGLRANHAIMESGTPALVADAKSVKSERWFSKTRSYEYMFHVTYEDAQGVRHSAERYSPEGPGRKLEVRFDPRDPSRFGMNWLESSAERRWFDVYFHAFLLALVPASFTYLALKDGGRLRHARRVSFDGVDTALEVISKTPAPLKGDLTRAKYRVSYTDPRGEKRQASFTRPDHEVCWLDSEGKQLVGVVSPRFPRKPFIVGLGFSPFGG